MNYFYYELFRIYGLNGVLVAFSIQTHILSAHNMCKKELGRVVRKLINANPGLNVVQGFCFSCLKAFPVLNLRDNLKAAKVKFPSENNLQESTPLS